MLCSIGIKFGCSSSSISCIKSLNKEPDQNVHVSVILNDQVNSSCWKLKSQALPWEEWEWSLDTRFLTIKLHYIVIQGDYMLSIDPESRWVTSKNNCLNIINVTRRRWLIILKFVRLFWFFIFLTRHGCFFDIDFLLSDIVRCFLVSVNWNGAHFVILNYNLLSILRNLQLSLKLEVIH